jgi:hypothetical protein
VVARTGSDVFEVLTIRGVEVDWAAAVEDVEAI